MPRHFLKETDFSYDEAAGIFTFAKNLKDTRGKVANRTLEGQTWAMLFSKSSTRTRVSFQVGLYELGANALFLPQDQLQIGRGETLADTAKVLSRYVHGLIVRCHGHDIVDELSTEGTVPVINALTDLLHPCQIYTDTFTLAERWVGSDGNLLGALKGRKVAYLGDCANNMSNSWILGAAHFGMEIALAGPEEYRPGPELDALLEAEGLPKNYTFTTDPYEAVKGADAVTTDVWVSMGQENEEGDRVERLRPYGVTGKLFATAKPDAYFLHCLPAHVGMEVSQEVYQHPRSIVFDEAENRLHVQKAILAQLTTLPLV